MTTQRIVMAMVLVAGLLAALPAAANEWLWGVTYEPSLTVGDLKDFSGDSFSWRGMGFEGRTWLAEEVSIGFAVSWNVFHSKISNGTWSTPGQDLFGTQLRDVNSVPIYLTGHRYWGQRDDWRPFLGMNAGTIYADHRLDMGLYSLRESNWHLAVAPELGLQLPYYRLLGYVSVRWNYGFKSGDIDEVSYFSFRLGIGLR